MDEILGTEIEYVKTLELIRKLYFHPILRGRYEISLKEITAIFGNLEDVLPYHKSLVETLSDQIESEKPDLITPFTKMVWK